MKVAILGLGIIGSEWAKNLEVDGLLSATWNRTNKPGFPKIVSSPEEAVSKAEIIHLVLSDEQITLGMIKRILPSLKKTQIVLQSATIDPKTSSQIKSLVEGVGARYIEAPFTGSLPAAKERKIIFYLGSDKGSVDLALPYLTHISARQFHIGSNEQACTLKLAMNLQIASAVAALSEALTVSRKSGISDELFFSAFKENASYSGVAKLKEQKLKDSDFAPQFSVKHMAKDMRLLAQSRGTEALPILATVRELLSAAEKAGLSDEDFSAMIKLRG